MEATLEQMQAPDFQGRAFARQLRYRTPSEPFICCDGEILTLQFQSDVVQSEMWSGDPTALMLSYTRTMIGFLLFNRSPERIAMIGLGGGSLPKWCYAHLPASDIKVIEINPRVVGLRDAFCIPADDHRFHIICGDGADYVALTADAPDIILVDGFDFDGQPPQLCSQVFYDDCYRALNEDGVLVVNLCGSDNSLFIERIRRSFHQKELVVLPEDGTNLIVFAVKGERLWLENKQLETLLTRLSPRAEYSPMALCSF
jgi:spermidine synthase